MKSKITLSRDDRSFFRLVGDAAFSNPFSARRDELDRALGGVTKSRSNQLQAAIASVYARVQSIEHLEQAKLSLYDGEDRESLALGMLFAQYHRYMDDFDTLIEQQLKQGDAPCPVPFAPAILKQLRTYGFSAREASHYLAFFYQLRRAFYFIGQLIGHSTSMRDLRCALWNNIFTHDARRYETLLWDRMEDFSTLLLGETGTGKGAAAAAIGRSGFIPFDNNKGCFAESFTRNFISINLSQFSENLIESELFGHKKGAFTGAVEQHQGILARCVPYGAIFLDEIGDVSPQLQIKLLKVLQERTFTPVGGHQPITFRGRIIAATNRSLVDLRSDGRFRDDFYYRLCSDVIEVPALRYQLSEDQSSLAALCDHLLERITSDRDPELRDQIIARLNDDLPPNYPWPGNVRELEQALRRILLNNHYRGDPMVNISAHKEFENHFNNADLDAQQLLSSYCRLLHKRYGSYEEVARRLKLDRRTVKKYIVEGD